MTAAPWISPFESIEEQVLYSPNAWELVRLGGHYLPGIASVSGAALHRIDVQKANGVDGGTLIERGYQPGEFDIDLMLWTAEQWKIWQKIRPQIFRSPHKNDLNDRAAEQRGAASAMLADIADQVARGVIPEIDRKLLGLGPQQSESSSPRRRRLESLYEALSSGGTGGGLSDDALLAQIKNLLAQSRMSLAREPQKVPIEKGALPVSHPGLVDAGITACLIKSITIPKPGSMHGTLVVTIKCIQYVAPAATPKNALRKGVPGTGVGAPKRDPRNDMMPTRNTPTKPSDAGDGLPNGPPPVSQGAY